MSLEVPPEELERASLYDIARQKREERDQLPITRLVYATYFSESALQKIDIESLLKQEVKHLLYCQIKEINEQMSTQVTGFLLLRGLFSLHVIESDASFTNFWIKHLWEEFSKEKSVYQIINIITVNEDNPARCFDKWYCENLFQSGPQLTEMDKNDQQAMDRVWELYLQICSAGTKHKERSAKDKQNAKIANDVPITLDDINLLLHERFMAISEYVQMYIDDVQIELDGEELFPQTPSLTKNLEFHDHGKFDN